MTLMRIIRDKNALEIVRNIIRETALGNVTGGLLFSLALPMLKYSAPVVLFALILITAALIIFIWMTCYVLIYFRELEAIYPRLSKAIMFFWAVIFEISVIVGVWKISPLIHLSR
ncbi:hypothetical protein IAE30_27575 [Pantoea sp. S61]|uniref:hypothetical protein n=1 Tax=Pantoea sp. S61 TaxID=2767442 RepID=UPI00190C5254|nr:hypothetical protein [Pantoea sp. S61]MBK0127504.1 hypothetical protein [Pantoea sp. S61]